MKLIFKRELLICYVSIKLNDAFLQCVQLFLRLVDCL